MTILIANAIDFVAALIQVASGSIKKKSRILAVQIVQLLMQAISMVLLGGYTGAVSNVLSCWRNYLCYKGKLSTLWKILLTAASLAMTLAINNQGLLGYLPFVVCTLYILLIDLKDPVHFKLLLTLSFIPWLIYHLILGSYTGAFFDAATVVTNGITLFFMARDKKNKKDT
jgi:hypothetical protein